MAVEGEPPSPLHPPPGCRFHTRCLLASDRCRVEEPLLQEIGSGHWWPATIMTRRTGRRARLMSMERSTVP